MAKANKPQRPKAKPQEAASGTTPESTTTQSSPTSTEQTQTTFEDIKLSLLDIFRSLESGYGDKGTEVAKRDCIKNIQKYLWQIVGEIPESSNYNIVILFDDSTLVKNDADKIYNAVTKFKNSKPILLILFSRGGSAAAAYLIGKLCLEHTKDRFVVSVPRYAKSAATLICCAASEIHMGSLSELGPIDPQINGLPALGLKNAIQHIAELIKIHPESSDMFAKYLQGSLPLIDLGYYERVAESAKQYAEQLLTTHEQALPRMPKEIADDLVYKYKDHGFVIDKVEAKLIFGDIIKTNTPEYEIGNKIYNQLNIIKSLAAHFKYNFYFIGSIDSEPTFTYVE